MLWLGVSPARGQEPDRSESDRSELVEAVESIAHQGERASEFAVVDETLVEIEELLAEGHFRTVLVVAGLARASLDQMAERPGASQRAAQLDVLVGTSQVALSRETAARSSFRQAIEADPDLTLDQTTTSPRVLRVFEAARRAGSGS